jgi:hypothetical protein
LRRTHRDGGKVKHQTLANLGRFPPQVVDTIEAALKGAQLVPAGEAITITGRCRAGMSPRSLRWPASWACPRCWAQLAGNATSRWR